MIVVDLYADENLKLLLKIENAFDDEYGYDYMDAPSDIFDKWIVRKTGCIEAKMGFDNLSGRLVYYELTFDDEEYTKFKLEWC